MGKRAMGNDMNNDQDKGLESLQIWKDSLQLAVDICKNVIPLFPIDEKYALTTQIRRSAQSIPANIAEGYGRYYYQEGIHYCYIARGSLEETKTHLILAYQLGYIPEQNFLSLRQRMDSIRRQINGYIAHLKNSKRGINEPGSNIRELSTPYVIDYFADSSDLSIDPLPIDPSPID
jgi:four helix bundle protein